MRDGKNKISGRAQHPEKFFECTMPILNIFYKSENSTQYRKIRFPGTLEAYSDLPAEHRRSPQLFASRTQPSWDLHQEQSTSAPCERNHSEYKPGPQAASRIRFPLTSGKSERVAGRS